MAEPSALEARVAALEARLEEVAVDASAARELAAGADRDVSEVRAELRAHTRALNALRETQVEMDSRLGRVETTLAGHTATLAEHTGYLRSLDEGQAEIKDLLVRALGPDK